GGGGGEGWRGGGGGGRCDVHGGGGSGGEGGLARFVQDCPDQADREGGCSGGAGGQAAASREGAIPERGKDCVFREVTGLAHEAVQGVELSRRRPRGHQVQQGNEQVLGVLGASYVG